MKECNMNENGCSYRWLLFQVDLAHMLAARDQELRTLSAEVCLAYSTMVMLLFHF